MSTQVSLSYKDIVLTVRVTNSSGVVTHQGTKTLPRFEIKQWRTTGPNWPDWKDRIKNGFNATTELTAGRRTLKVGTLGYVRRDTGGSLIACNEVWGSRHLEDPKIPYGTLEAFDAALLEKARAEARTNLIKSYRNALSQWQSGVFLGELPELIRFLKSPARSLARLTTQSWVDLAKGLRRLGRGRIDGKSSGALRAATDSWLAWQYAVKPLMNDIKSAAEALEAYRNSDPFKIYRLRGDGKAKSDERTQTYLTALTTDQGVTIGSNEASVLVTKKKEITVRYLGAYKAKGPQGTLTPAEQFGFGPENWAPTVWELIPYSFVLDYFSNIGKMIDAFSFQMVELEWLQETDRQMYDVQISDQSYDNPGSIYGPPPNPVTRRASGGRVRDKHFLVHRQVVSNNFVPDFQLKLPSLGQSLNLAALINSSLPFRR